MDALYVFRHSVHRDLEIRYSLRSIEKHAPYIRKVWIFGDRPSFLSDDPSLVQQVPHSYVTRVGHFRTPLTNFLHLLFLSSLIPDLDFEYLWFCDDFFLLRPFPIEEARKVRYLEYLGEVKKRGQGLWLDSLWRTCRQREIFAEFQKGSSGASVLLNHEVIVRSRRADGTA